MRKLYLLPFLFLFTNADATELNNYNQVKSALVSGKSIHIKTNLPKCSLVGNKNKATPQALNVFTPDDFNIDTNGAIVTSYLHFKYDNHHLGKPVYHYIEVVLTPDNKITLASETLGEKDYNYTGADKYSLNCMLGEGTKIYD